MSDGKKAWAEEMEEEAQRERQRMFDNGVNYYDVNEAFQAIRELYKADIPLTRHNQLLLEKAVKHLNSCFKR